VREGAEERRKCEFDKKILGELQKQMHLSLCEDAALGA
jgi:hypothetical protein